MMSTTTTTITNAETSTSTSTRTGTVTNTHTDTDTDGNFAWSEKDDDELYAMLETLTTVITRTAEAAYCDGRADVSDTPIDEMDDVYRGHYFDVQREMIDRGLI